MALPASSEIRMTWSLNSGELEFFTLQQWVAKTSRKYGKKCIDAFMKICR
jgi:hypothetical protein